MKCEICGKVTEPSKKNLIKEVVIKKGHIINIETKDNYTHFESKFWSNDVYHYKNESWKLKAKKDLIALYIICPVCDKKNLIHHPSEPCYFVNHLSYNKDEWEIVDYNKTTYTKRK